MGVHHLRRINRLLTIRSNISSRWLQARKSTHRGQNEAGVRPARSARPLPAAEQRPHHSRRRCEGSRPRGKGSHLQPDQCQSLRNSAVSW